MPKQRNSGIASRGTTTSTFEEQEMSNRIEQRLVGAGTITVEVESRSRGTREQIGVRFGQGTAVVSSGSGNEYSVDLVAGACTCPDYTNRQRRCRHIEAVDIAREQVTQGTFAGSQTDIQVNPSQFTSEHIENETNSEVQNRQRVYQDDAFFYTDNQELYQQDLERLAAATVPYYHENVLNESDITFGIELEFVNGNSNAIARELYDMGICSSPSMSRYHSQRQEGKWILESDGSVTVGNRGGELISPILSDTPETWRNIEIICEVAKRHGARVNTKTGGHIHIGAEPVLDGKRQRWRRFFKAATGFESVFHRLAGGEQGRFRGGHYTGSAQIQNRRGIRERMPEDGDTHTFQRIIQNISRGKYQSINIGSFASKKTIEFRAFNGTLTPGVIQANVKYAAGMINTCQRSRIKDNEGLTATASDKKRGRIINDYENNNQNSDLAVMKTLDAVFSRKEDKEHILSVIAKNQWE